MTLIAKVIPLKRMPRSIGVFDYAIPPEITGDLLVGQLVVIPLRKKTIVGVICEILKVENEKAEKLKYIEKIINNSPILTKRQVKNILMFAQLYGVSVGVMANMILPPIKKLKLKKQEIHIINNIKKTIKPNTSFYRYKNKQDRISFIKKHINNKNNLFLFAKKSDLEDVYNNLDIDQKNKKRIVIYTSSLTEKQKFEAWFKVKNQDNITIFGTRSAVFLPFNNLDNIFIDFEHSNQHKHWDQAPRFHAKDIANILQKQFSCNIFLASFAPSVDSYYKVHKKLISGESKNLLPTHNTPIIIDMRKEEKERISHLISYPCEQAINRATGAIFIHINKKGYSHGVGCNQCKHTFKCPTCRLSLVYHKKTNSLECHYCHIVQSSFQKCPKCNSTERFTFGYGIEQLAEEVKVITKNLKGYSHIVIDADNPPNIELNENHIIIGTDAAFSFIPWNKTSTIIFANIDQTLQVPEYTAAEHGFMQMELVSFYKQDSAEFYVQTFNPEHVVLMRLNEPDYFYRMDLNLRRALLYPPYGDMIRYFYGNRDIRVSKTAAFAMHDKLSKALTKDKIRAKISSPVEMHPKWYRTKFWYTIVIKSEPEDWEKNLLWLNRQFSDTWKVDPNPSSILHP